VRNSETSSIWCSYDFLVLNHVHIVLILCELEYVEVSGPYVAIALVMIKSLMLYWVLDTMGSKSIWFVSWISSPNSKDSV